MIRRVGRFGWSRRLTAAAFLALIAVGGRVGPGWFTGTAAATEIGGVLRLVDPLAALESSLASRSLGSDVLLGAGLLLGFAVLMGPVFCGWVCPMGLLLDLNEGLRVRVARLLGRRGVRLPAWHLPRRVASRLRFAALGGLLGFAVVGRWPVFQIVSPIQAVASSVAHGATALLALSALVLAIDWLAPRIWCRALCPLGATYALAGAFAPFRVRVDLAEAGRTPCLSCSRHCPMGVPVMEEFALQGRPSVDALECNRCGACVDACPSSVLGFGVADRAGRRSGKTETPRSAVTGPARDPRRVCEVGS